MKQFIKVPKAFLKDKNNTKFVDLLVYSILDNQRDGNSNKSRIAMLTIEKKYGIATRKVEDAIKRLKENGWIDIQQIKSTNNDYVFNEYSFPKMDNGGFLMLDPDILSLNYKPKERGVLISLQLACSDGINEIPVTTINDLANLIGITRQTASKYVNMFIKDGEITKSEFGYFVCKYLVKKDNIIKEKKNTNLEITL